MTAIDLNARRAARAEQRAKDGVEPMSVIVDGKVYVLAAELPADIIDQVQAGEFGKAIRALVGPDNADLAWVAALTVDDVKDIFELYGEQLGN